ncbi:MAG: hypothetical protein C5B58_07070 [Acidobacteria bacterium]|nr:MAG: hypothetical protein C5B58_07070 [Acidobacteriota bacterium]
MGIAAMALAGLTVIDIKWLSLPQEMEATASITVPKPRAILDLSIETSFTAPSADLSGCRKPGDRADSVRCDFRVENLKL